MNPDIYKVLPYLGEYKEHGDEIHIKVCPFCNNGTGGDKWKFAINAETGAWNCKRGSCGEAGSISNLMYHFGIYERIEQVLRPYKPKKKYREPVKDKYIDSKGNEKQIVSLSDHVVKYFESRGISRETLIRNRVESDEKNNAVLNFYDESNHLVFRKLRITRSAEYIDKTTGEKKKIMKSWCDVDLKQILYGMNECVKDEPLVITEGEPDKMALDECGIKNALSMPLGSESFEWIDNCWDFIQQFNEIILWIDGDKAGKKCRDELIVKLSDFKLSYVVSEYKDANEALVKAGKAKVISLIKSATPVNKQYIVDLADVKRNEHYEPVTTGITSLDQMIGGFYPGQLVIWTGYNGSGKSSIISNIMLNVINEGHKVFAYSGELPKEDFKEWMDLQSCGTKHLSSYECKVKKQSISIPKPECERFIDDFYRGKMYLFDSEDYATDIEVIKAMEYMAKREDCKHFLIDNMMTTPLSGKGEINEKQAKYVISLKKFARKHGAVVHLVAHPRKPQMGQIRVDKYSVSGTANITDLADRVIGVHRLTKKEKDDEQYQGYSTILTVFKDRKFGVFDEEVKLMFNFFSKRFYEVAEDEKKDYSWVKAMGKVKKMAVKNFSEEDEKEWWEEA